MNTEHHIVAKSKKVLRKTPPLPQRDTGPMKEFPMAKAGTLEQQNNYSSIGLKSKVENK